MKPKSMKNRLNGVMKLNELSTTKMADRESVRREMRQDVASRGDQQRSRRNERMKINMASVILGVSQALAFVDGPPAIGGTCPYDSVENAKDAKDTKDTKDIWLTPVLNRTIDLN